MDRARFTLALPVTEWIRLAPMWPVIITVVVVLPLLVLAWMRVRRR
jgi:hypothetical protein